MELALSAILQQKQNITTEMRQSLEILQMSYLDLNRFLLEQAEDNPFLEYTSKQWIPSQNPLQSSASMHDNDWWLNVYQDSETSLEAALMEQIKYMDFDSVMLRICKFIIGNLDERGYLMYDAEGIARHLQVGVDQVRAAIKLIQGIEPIGLAASTLEECLLIQLDYEPGEHALARSLIEFDLKEIAKGKMQQLAKKYNVSISDIQNAKDHITKLDPKPGARFNKEKPQYIIPDLILRKNQDQYEVMVDEATVPVVSLSSFYVKMMDRNDSKEWKQYLKEQWQTAKKVIYSLNQRNLTLIRVASVIFDIQSEFCAKGPAHIIPLSMKEVANILQVHESTVSRTVNHKYVSTPWGIYELKHFFTSSIMQTNGTTVSAIQTKEQIREIIENEDCRKPLSDQKIAEKLKQAGIEISRRTVTKYREQMNILSTTQRKRYE